MNKDMEKLLLETIKIYNTLHDDDIDSAVKQEISIMEAPLLAGIAVESLRKIDMFNKLIDGAYHERDILVSVVANMFKDYASVEIQDPESVGYDPEFKYIVYIDFPEFQLSWHIGNDELDLFEGIPMNKGIKWDGHSSVDKYKNLTRFSHDSEKVNERIFTTLENYGE